MQALWENLFHRNDKGSEVKKLLKQTYLFQDLSQKELNLLEGMVHTRIYKPGEPVFREGEIGVGVYILKEGSVEIRVESDSEETNETAHHSVITQLKPGDFFGELSLVEEGSRRGASAFALQDSVLVGFFKPDLFEIIERNPSVGAKIILRLSEVLGKRLRVTTEKVSRLKLQVKELVNSRQGSETNL